MTTKVCKSCGSTKAVDLFTIMSVNPKSSKVYYKSRCKACEKEISKKYYHDRIKVKNLAARGDQPKKKTGRKSIIETDPELKERIETLMVTETCIAKIARAVGVSQANLYRMIKSGIVHARVPNVEVEVVEVKE